MPNEATALVRRAWNTWRRTNPFAPRSHWRRTKPNGVRTLRSVRPDQDLGARGGAHLSTGMSRTRPRVALVSPRTNPFRTPWRRTNPFGGGGTGVLQNARIATTLRNCTKRFPSKRQWAARQHPGKVASMTTESAPPPPAVDHGALPPWEVSELPAPPPFNARNLFKVIGPGAVMAATSIGGGEWLVGPANAVKFGTSIFLIATVAIALQVVFNLEAIRYTLYTGEPIYGGIMRLRPGAKFWAGFYSVVGFLQLGWPALAGAAAAALLSAFLGNVPGPGDRGTQIAITAGLLLFVVLILSFGGTIERMLEYFSWTMLAVIFGFLIVVNIAYVPFSHWWSTFLGFFKLSGIQHPVDWRLVGALAATAGSGGLGNLTVTNWVRDKGFGMGAVVGAIPSAFGGHHLQLSPVGTIFRVNEQSLARWKEWMKYVLTDQIWVWGLFCFLGMYLNVNLATHIIPRGTDMQAAGAGAYQALYLKPYWNGFWFVTLFCGFWLLLKTQLGN